MCPPTRKKRCQNWPCFRIRDRSVDLKWTSSTKPGVGPPSSGIERLVRTLLDAPSHAPTYLEEMILRAPVSTSVTVVSAPESDSETDSTLTPKRTSIMGFASACSFSHRSKMAWEMRWYGSRGSVPSFLSLVIFLHSSTLWRSHEVMAFFLPRPLEKRTVYGHSDETPGI